VALCADENKMTTPTTTRKTCVFFFTGLDRSHLDRSRFEEERKFQCEPGCLVCSESLVQWVVGRLVPIFLDDLFQL